MRSAHKFHAVRTPVDGVSFPSKKEARRYSELKLLERARVIADLELQPKFVFEINGKLILLRSKGYPNGRAASYKADFRYRDVKTGEIVVEDTKSPATRTEAHVLRLGLVEAIFGVRVREV